MAKNKTLQAIVEIAGTLSPTLQEAVSGVTDKLDGINLKAAAVGAAFAGATIAASKALIDFSKEAVEVAASYETAFAAASTLMKGADEEIQAISDDIIKTSNETGIAAEDLANSVYSAISAGIDQEDAVAFAGQAARLAAAGFTDVDTALSATAKTLNAYGMEASQAEEIQKVLIQTQNLGITTVGELGASLAQVTPTAAAFGVSFDQVGASLAVMTAQGTPTAQATTQLNSLIAELAKNGTVAANNLAHAAEGTQYAGMSFNEMMDSGANLADVLEMLQASADSSGVSMVDMFSSIEAGKAALAIFSGEGEKFREDLQGMTTNEDVLGEAYDKVSGTFEHQMEILKNLGQNAKISFGERLLPIITEVAQTAIPMIQDALDQLLPVFDELSQNLAPVIKDLIPQVLPLITELIPPIVSMASTLASEIIPPVVKIVTSLIPLALSILNALMPIVQIIIDTILPILVDLIELLIPPITTIIMTLLPVIQQLLTAIAPLITQLFTALSPVLTAVGELISALLPPIISIIQALMPVITACANIITSVLCVAFQALSPIINGITTLISGFADMIASAFSGLVGIVKGPINAVISLVNSAIGAINNISVDVPAWVPVLGGTHFGFSIPTIPMLASGGFTDGLSIAGEAGTEAVISFNKAYRRDNVGYWAEAGRMLGLYGQGTASALAGELLNLDDFSLAGLTTEGSTTIYDFSGMQYNPVVNMQEAGSGDIMQQLRQHADEFMDWLTAWTTRRGRVAYG